MGAFLHSLINPQLLLTRAKGKIMGRSKTAERALRALQVCVSLKEQASAARGVVLMPRAGEGFVGRHSGDRKQSEKLAAQHARRVFVRRIRASRSVFLRRLRTTGVGGDQCCEWFNMHYVKTLQMRPSDYGEGREAADLL